MSKNSIGLDPEEIRKMLMEEHQVPLEEHDPILMEVTLFNAFIQEYNRLLQLHHGALKKSMTSILGENSKELRELSNALMNEAVRTTIENTVTEIAIHKTAMETFLAELRRFYWVTIGCSVICVLAVVGVMTLGGVR